MCIDGTSPFSMLVCFCITRKDSVINSGHLASILAVLKICLNSGSTRAGKAKFAGAFSSFQNFNGYCTMSLHTFLLCSQQNQTNPIYFYEGRMMYSWRGKKACSDMKSHLVGS